MVLSWCNRLAALSEQAAGYLPWHLVASEMRQLTTALSLVTAVSLAPKGIAALESTTDEQLRPGNGSNPVLMVRFDGHGAWLPSIEPVCHEPVVFVTSTFDVKRAQAVQSRVRRSSATWQLDLLPAPFGIGEAQQRLEASWLGMVVEGGSGLALNMGPFLVREVARPAEFLLDTVEQTHCLPARIRTCRRDVAESLVPVAKALGCSVSRKPHLAELESLYHAALAH